MKKLALVALTAGAVIGIVGGASAQGFYFGFGTEPSYGPDLRPASVLSRIPAPVLL